MPCQTPLRVAAGTGIAQPPNAQRGGHLHAPWDGLVAPETPPDDGRMNGQRDGRGDRTRHDAQAMPSGAR